MMPKYHPTPDMLLDYATGTLSEAASLLMATHLTYCPHCRAEVRRLEAVGGVLVEDLPDTPVATRLEALLDRLDEPAPSPAAPLARPPGFEWAPMPLAPYLAKKSWHGFMPGMAQITLKAAGGSMRLLKVKAGRAMPMHTHKGREIVAILQGGFADSGKDFGPGDMAIASDDDLHQPMAHADEDCICLYLIEGRLKLPGLLGTLLNRFIPH
jgi:putative transcriptional regulator